MPAATLISFGHEPENPRHDEDQPLHLRAPSRPRDSSTSGCAATFQRPGNAEDGNAA